MNDTELLESLLKLFYEGDRENDLEWGFAEGFTVGDALGQELAAKLVNRFKQIKRSRLTP